MSAFVQKEKPGAVKLYGIDLTSMREARRQEKVGSVPKTDVGPFLEPHHTHFLLVDNGTNGQFHTEIPLRDKLEAHIVASSVPLI